MTLLGDILGREPIHTYVSGPMRNRDGFNFPAFFGCEAALLAASPFLTIFNPARQDVAREELWEFLDEDPTGLSAGRFLQAEDTPFDIRTALREDMDFICTKCDLLILLPEWEQSSGARAEYATALALGIECIEWERLAEALADPGRTTDTTPDLQEAEMAVSGALSNLEADTLREHRATAASGGQKGVKLAAFDQISPQIEWELAEHFGMGARKYAAHNFRRGYPWSYSYSALRRHLADFWSGKEWDECPEGCPDWEGDYRENGKRVCKNHTGSRHIVAALWHANTLAEFSHYDKFKEYDDRYVYDQS